MAFHPKTIERLGYATVNQLVVRGVFCRRIKAVGITSRLKGDTTSSPDNNNNKNEESLSEWIPPNHPFPGDKGQSHLYKKPKEALKDKEPELFGSKEDEIAYLEQALQELQEGSQEPSSSGSVDWLRTRRRRREATELLTPDMAAAKKREASDLPVIPDTLLTDDEIEACLASLGGQDFRIIEDGLVKRMGGAKGMVFVTATTPHHANTLAETLVRQLKRRGLGKLGVIGAKLGSEGDKDDAWRVVDCKNYMVHIQLEEVRKQLNLEAIWSGEDPLHSLNTQDEDAVDDYVAANPVPYDYGRERPGLSDTLTYLKRWNLEHKSVVSKPKKKHGNRKKKRPGYRR